MRFIVMLLMRTRLEKMKYEGVEVEIFVVVVEGKRLKLLRVDLFSLDG
jgi:hypothetical protein